MLRTGDEQKIVIDIAEIKAKRVKTTILSGFLGAGKTTLLNHIIRQNQESRIAILVNDFGQINIDSDLILSRDENKLDLTGGCICCTIQKDLLTGVINLMKQDEKPDHIIVECSGAADPSQVLNTLSSPLLKFHLYVDGLFTVIDSSQLLRSDKACQDLLECQIKPANLLILNKIDLIDVQTLKAVKEYVRKISPKAVMLESAQCQVPFDLIFGFKDLPELKRSGKLKEMDVHVHSADEPAGVVEILPSVPAQEKSIKHDLVFESYSFRSAAPFSKTAFNTLLDDIPADIIRAKGFVFWDDPEDPLVLLNLVGQWIDIDVFIKKEEAQITETRLVFIGKPGWKKKYDVERKLNDCLIQSESDHTPGN